MNIQGFLQHLGFEVKQAGSQLQVKCPDCDDNNKHLYIAPGNGVGHCHKCGYAPNPYLLAQKVTGKEPREIFTLLEQFGLHDSTMQRTGGGGQRTEDSTGQKKLALCKDDIRELTEAEKQSFCQVKQIDAEAFERFKPYAHRNKPWVLIPAYNPAETNKACGWLRAALDGEPISMGGEKKVKYPIISGSRHGLLGLPWLQSEDPEKIIFTEAWRDMAACLAIGLHATASSGGASCFNDEWLSFFEGKSVFIAMDADIPGQKAAKRAAEKISTVAEVYIVTLPYELQKDHGQDVFDYISETDKDFLLLLSKAEKYVPMVDGGDGQHIGRIVFENDHPDTIGEAFRMANAEKYRYNSIDGWSVFSDGRYEHIDDENEVGVCIRRYLRRCYYTKVVGKNVVEAKVKPSNSRIKDIMGSLAALEGVHIRPELHTTSSLTGKYDPKQIIAMKNCLLDISADEPKQLPLTDEFYTFNYLPFEFDPDATCEEFIEFLGQVFTIKRLSTSSGYDGQVGDLVEEYETVPDDEAICILQEWFGCFVSGDTHWQKIFGLLGPRRSGKSTMGKVIRTLIGAKNTVSPTLSTLSSEFGLQPMLNKTMAIIADANISGRASDVNRAVERLKSISGEDAQQINRKNKTHLEVDRLGVRFLIIANEMQDMRDSSGALASRFNFLVTTESFLGREDVRLEERLLSEIPGIFLWALAGLKRLRVRGFLLEHPASRESRDDFEALSSPMTAFVNEWCDVGPGLDVPVDALWKAHGDWSKQNGRGDGFSKQKFTLKIKSVVPGLVKERRRLDLSTLELEYTMDRGSDDNRVHAYLGIDLKEEYRKRVDRMDTLDKGWTP